jgi:glycogen(starch) synthase
VQKRSHDDEETIIGVRILHILDHSLPMHSGYTFRTRAILKAQIACGWTVAGVTGPRHEAGGPDEEIVEGLTFFRTGVRPGGPSPLREWREIGAFADRIDAVVRDWKPDILHAHSPVLNAVAAQRVADRHGIPLVYEIRAFWEDAAVGNGTGREGSARYRVTRALETRAVKRADAVAVICEGLRRDLVARGIDPARSSYRPTASIWSCSAIRRRPTPRWRRLWGWWASNWSASSAASTIMKGWTI